MNQELGFETIPFEIAPEFQSEVFERGKREGRGAAVSQTEIRLPFPFHGRTTSRAQPSVFANSPEEATGTKAQTKRLSAARAVGSSLTVS